MSPYSVGDLGFDTNVPFMGVTRFDFVFLCVNCCCENYYVHILRQYVSVSEPRAPGI